jgi:Lysyl oxidase
VRTTPRGRTRSILVVCAVAVTVAVPGGGSAGASTAARPAVAQDRLPDLIMLPPEAFHWGYQDGERGLRFTSLIENVGEGPLDLTGTRPDPQQAMVVTQNVMQSDGKQRQVSTGAVMTYSVKDGHDHFHILDVAQYRIRPVDSTTWRDAHKEGFCFTDDADLRGEVPRGYTSCGDGQPKALRVDEGLSAGWIDNYDWTLWGQYFDLRDVPLPGYFCVELTVDPGGVFTEETRANNTAASLIHLTDDTVDVVGEGC